MHKSKARIRKKTQTQTVAFVSNQKLSKMILWSVCANAQAQFSTSTFNVSKTGSQLGLKNDKKKV
jgi:hypothetical protein